MCSSFREREKKKLNVEKRNEFLINTLYLHSNLMSGFFMSTFKNEIKKDVKTRNRIRKRNTPYTQKKTETK